jgi:hypothetical protein
MEIAFLGHLDRELACAPNDFFFGFGGTVNAGRRLAGV